ncbi:lipoprotein [Caballeronia arationis]|jgi:hypothetical protein|uniref:Lipoprotein n=1 Tax=Caballeronia arationis TaxID=1777142 RepID=A0A7Z7IB93_9BURK|nr:hypothetical protein [Caballeronia arationis]SAK67897.1 lipoprotein [Caballeronia arationis]SOE82010.1 hypothetical protein SAMN05446927_5314 [Caballeronia arationis]
MKNAAWFRGVSLSVSALTAAALLTGCTMDPPGPSPIYSRLPSAQTQPAQPLSKDEQERYNQIDQQVLAEQQQAMAADAQAQAWSQYYRAPVSIYGGYSSGGWGGGPYWGTGVGFGTGYWW